MNRQASRQVSTTHVRRDRQVRHAGTTHTHFKARKRATHVSVPHADSKPSLGTYVREKRHTQAGRQAGRHDTPRQTIHPSFSYRQARKRRTATRMHLRISPPLLYASPLTHAPVRPSLHYTQASRHHLHIASLLLLTRIAPLFLVVTNIQIRPQPQASQAICILELTYFCEKLTDPQNRDHVPIVVTKLALCHWMLSPHQERIALKREVELD